MLGKTRGRYDPSACRMGCKVLDTAESPRIPACLCCKTITALRPPLFCVTKLSQSWHDALLTTTSTTTSPST